MNLILLKHYFPLHTVQYLPCVRLLQCGDEGGSGNLPNALGICPVALLQHHVPYTLEVAIDSSRWFLCEGVGSHGDVVRSSGH